VSDESTQSVSRRWHLLSRHAARTAGDQRGMTMIEVLMAASISVILGGMIIGTWWALTNSYASTAKRGKATDTARLAVARMEREIRDAEQPPASIAEVAITRARPFYIVLYTSFNKAGNEDYAGTPPRLVMYRLYEVTQPDGRVVEQLWRFHDADGDGSIDNVNITQDGGFDPDDREDGEGAQLMVSNVVNMVTPSTSSPTPVFTYIYYSTTGSLDSANDVRGVDNRSRIRSVELNLLVDMNPGKSPVYTHMRTTAQLRNTR
jgi:prepilin-type N-terminal cleavage/methylation domain-containing protein